MTALHPALLALGVYGSVVALGLVALAVWGCWIARGMQ